ncbi:chemotaxis protein CheC [Pelagirhabdus alkalitolerans]|uniref:Chemotaxis protein CheC n=1 Tax=Pelagirhabdus alkalitolerans TaxID=1612202 RepID=A0A1G6H414_9BACI|nr:chemotaxis protein CheC [Pelagirhabdus alkalitolerans]SDB88893.1 chemotaxis protein CheC [Pelagirhabdus alkalitolerans]
MSFIESLTNYQLDALKEVGNIGAGNAATSLSMLLNHKVDMKVPAVRVVDYDEMMDLVGGAETLIASVFLRIEGDAPGNMFFVLKPEEADTFVRQMVGSDTFKISEPPHDEMALSALQEIGNILAGSYLSALSDFIHISLQPSVPVLAIDMAGAILAEGLLEISQVSDYAIIIDTIIDDHDDDNEPVRGHFFLLPDPDSFPKIFNQLGVEDQ